MKIEKLYIKTIDKYEETANLSLVSYDKANLKNPDRQLCLLGKENSFKENQTDGFCVKKFKCDILTSGLDYKTLKKGDLFHFDDVTLEITIVGKKCFADCPLRIKNNPCNLPRYTAFARVTKGGVLTTSYLK